MSVELVSNLSFPAKEAGSCMIAKREHTGTR
jgi:hypothetical protein